MMAHKVVLVTNVIGQNGAYLTEFLLEKGYEVHGLKDDQVHSMQKELTI